MIDHVSKAFFHTLAGSQSLKHLASRYGMRSPRSFARRFIAGETVEEAIDAARAIEASGLTQTLDLLGESVATMAEADVGDAPYLALIDKIVAAGIGRNISLKLTQLGLTIDRATCVDNLRRILDAAARARLLRAHRHGELAVHARSRSTSSRRCGSRATATSASCCSRTCRAAWPTRARMNELGARVRLVKGAYKEPQAVAYQPKADVDAAFVEIMQVAAGGGNVSGHRDARSGDDRGDASIRGAHATSPPTASSSRCCTASGAICSGS